MSLLDDLTIDEINTALEIQHWLRHELDVTPMYGMFCSPMKRRHVKLLHHILTVVVTGYLTQLGDNTDASNSEPQR